MAKSQKKGVKQPSHTPPRHRIVLCDSWAELRTSLEEAKVALNAVDGQLWFRGQADHRHRLMPSLMRCTQDLSDEDHDQFEQDVFFEFQARAAKLRELSLSDWDYLFYSRHYLAPTRVLDWTETFGIALSFALEDWKKGAEFHPCIWVLNPYELNRIYWGAEEIVLPKYLGQVDSDDDDDCELWDFGDLLTNTGKWRWDEPVAVYPLQFNERVSAQRGWFTVHGNHREALEEQCPNEVIQLQLTENCASEVCEILEVFGIDRFLVYPDLENLAKSITKQRLKWADSRRKAS